jgi:acyl-CoA dehydrogenase
VAATDPKKGSRGGLTVFLVDMDTPGVSIAGNTVHMMGDVTYEIALDDVKVPEENRIGNEGNGIRQRRSGSTPTGSTRRRAAAAWRNAAWR